MPNGKHILVVVGDPSADRHGAALVQALKQQDGNVRVSALGGAHLRKVANDFVYPLVDVGGFGFWEPLAKIPTLWKVKRRIRRLLENDPPEMVVLMDYYGFNIHIAELAKSRGIPVVYYISPQVWASRPGRIQRLARFVDRMLVLFPFEEAIYRQNGVPVTYVGHPLLEQLPEPAEPPASPRIGLLPGSRRNTVDRHLPIMAAAAELLHERFPNAEFLFFRPEELPESLYAPFLAGRPWLRVVTDPFYEERRRLTIALSVSGTAALENMLLGIPMVIMYRLSFLTFWIAKRLIRVPYIGLPNLLANRLIAPEHVQSDATPERLSKTIGSFLSDPERLRKLREELLKLREQLQGGASRRAAQEILGLMGARA
jgi:lipid-A-disaccharide synthase